MNWIEIAWIVMSAASLTLGVIHLFVWVKHRSRHAHLLFFVLAVSVTVFGVFELAMMRAPSEAAYAATLRWAHVPGALLVLAIVWLWRRGGADARRRAAVVGGSVVVCVIAIAGFAALSNLGWVRAPTVVMPGVFLIVLAMGYELGWDLVAATQLAERLRASEMRFSCRRRGRAQRDPAGR